MTRWRPLALVVVVAVALAGGLALRADGDDDPVDAALHELRADDNFTRASDAGATLTRVSADLQAAADRCRSGCDQLLTAAAFTRVAAVAVLRCRHLEIFEFRRDLRAYLKSLRDDSPLDPPPNPQC